MADLTPIPMGIPWDQWDPSLPHSHAHLYFTAQQAASFSRYLKIFPTINQCISHQTAGPKHTLAVAGFFPAPQPQVCC